MATQEEVKRRIAESEGFPIESIDSYVNFIKGEPYITGAGLQFKMCQQYGTGNFAVQGVTPTPEEYNLIRRMMGLKDEEALVLVRGEVWVKGFEKPFMDYGTTTPNNLKGFIKFSEYPLEMATRRATNRAMRLATATGMCSVDEVKEPVSSGHDSQTHTSTSTPAPASKEQVELIRNLGRNRLLSEGERVEVEVFLDGEPDKRAASGMIETLKAKLDGYRKNGRSPDKKEEREEDKKEEDETPANDSQMDEIERLSTSGYLPEKTKKAMRDYLRDGVSMTVAGKAIDKALKQEAANKKEVESAEA